MVEDRAERGEDLVPPPQEAMTEVGIDSGERTADEETQGQQTALHRHRLWRWGLALVVFGLAAVASFAAYQYVTGLWSDLRRLDEVIAQSRAVQQELREEFARANQELNTQRAQVREQEQAFRQQSQALSEATHKVQLQGETMEQAIRSIQERLGNDSGHWMVAEAEYLLRLAGRRLRLEADVPSAQAALEAADERLRATGNPTWVDVRSVLKGEISALQAVRLPPIDQLAATMDALGAQVPRLELATLAAPQETEEEASARQAQAPAGTGMDTVLERGWHELKSLVVIRQHRQPLHMALPPSQRFYAFQGLELQLEAARAALLRRDPVNYQAAMAKALSWFDEYFSAQADANQSFRAELERLKATEIRPQLPDISASLQLLRRRSGDGS